MPLLSIYTAPTFLLVPPPRARLARATARSCGSHTARADTPWSHLATCTSCHAHTPAHLCVDWLTCREPPRQRDRPRGRLHPSDQPLESVDANQPDGACLALSRSCHCLVWLPSFSLMNQERERCDACGVCPAVHGAVRIVLFRARPHVLLERRPSPAPPALAHPPSSPLTTAAAACRCPTG
jgi:hypothetical protein